MKRSPIKRKTPLKSKGRLRPVSASRRKYNAAATPARSAYLDEMRRCAVNGSSPSTEVHEIAGGTDRKKALIEPATWLAVGRVGHDEVQGWPKAKQLALKLIVDPMRFDLEKFNAVYTGQERPVTIADVAKYLEFIRG